MFAIFRNKNMVMCINFICEIINRIVKVGVIVFPGSNCDRDMFHVLTDVFHLNAQYFWHEKGLPHDIDAVVLPGGFSYGDRLRAGVIAANSPVINDVKKLANNGIPIFIRHHTECRHPCGQIGSDHGWIFQKFQEPIRLNLPAFCIQHGWCK